MFLKSLEVQGFKSFAKRTALSFEPGITAVVGPNGSGKSNIADAIRWVLGAQSKKAVRGKVGSDVIFSGSGKRAAMGLAEVSLVFDNAPVPGADSRKLPYEYDEVVVTRRLYRSGDSEYLVNGSQVRLTDLQHAFAVAGIGAENYTVIGQGMVDRVLSQSTKERRSLFEEAAGVRQFQLKRDEARRRLTETTTNLGRAEDIIKELDPRLKLLRRQASALEQKAGLEESLRDAYRARYGHRYRELYGDYRSVKAKQAEINQEFVAIERELKKLNSEVDQMRRSRQGLKLNELLAERNQVRDLIETLQSRLNQAVTDKEVATATSERLELQRRQLSDRQSELAKRRPKPAQPHSDAAAPLKQAEAALAEIEQRYDAAKQTMAPAAPGAARQAFAKLEKAIAEERPHVELAKLASKLKQLIPGAAEKLEQSDLTAVLAERDKAIKMLQDLRVQAAAHDAAAKLADRDLDRHQRETAAIKQQLDELDLEYAGLQRRIEDGAKTVDRLTIELQKEQRRSRDLEKQIKAEEQSSLGETEELDQQERLLKTKQETYEAYRRELADRNVELAKLETRLDDLQQEAAGKLGQAFPPTDDETLPEASQGEDANIDKLERKMLELGGIEPGVAEEYQSVEERFTFLTTQAADLRHAKDDLEKLIRRLERQSQTIFKESFAKINLEFGRHFATLFGGGKAELVLIEETVEDEAPTETDPTPGQAQSVARPGNADFGIDIKAVPPGKRVQNLSMLSGGERALTSVALLFAILTVNPSPFVMLDEVDAALDEANTARFAELLVTLSKQTQFVVVTHNRDTMRSSERLYGVTMDESGVSTMLSIKLPEAERTAGVA